MSHLGHFLSSGVGDLLPDNLLGGFWLLDNLYFFLFLTWVGGIKLLEVDDEEREEDADEGAGGK